VCVYVVHVCGLWVCGVSLCVFVGVVCVCLCVVCGVFFCESVCVWSC